MVNLPVGWFSKLQLEFSTFGNSALNTARPGFPNKGYKCDNEDPPLIWIDTLRSTYNHPSKYCFLIGESKHVTIINNMLPYSSSYREHLIRDIRLSIPNIYINVNIPHIHFCLHVQRSKDVIGSYIVVNTSEQNWTDIALIASKIHANNLLQVGVDSKKIAFLSFQTYKHMIGLFD